MSPGPQVLTLLALFLVFLGASLRSLLEKPLAKGKVPWREVRWELRLIDTEVLL